MNDWIMLNNERVRCKERRRWRAARTRGSRTVREVVVGGKEGEVVGGGEGWKPLFDYNYLDPLFEASKRDIYRDNM